MVCKAKEPIVHSHVILPPTMRNMATCLSEQAVKVSDSSCSGSGASSSSSSNNNNSNPLSVLDSSVQRSIASLHHARLSTSKQLFIELTWSKTSTGPTLTVSIEEITLNHDEKQKLATLSTQVLKKKKGAQSYVHRDSVLALLWDVSSAKFGSGPEPVDSNYYVVVMVDGEFALLRGGWSKDYININTIHNGKLEVEGGIPTAESMMLGRKEQVVIHSVYSTKARFRENGKDHEITIKCKGDSWAVKDSELSVYIDKKKVVYEKRPDWNFRGNQIMFVDGSPVDLMWDVHGWWFGGPSGCGVFMFRARSSLESRLWLEHEVLQKEQNSPGFTLLIRALKS